MSDSKEKISAYVDDDLSRDELGSLSPEDMQAGEGKYGVVSRYQMMGDAMRGELSDASMIDISAEVRESLRNETLDTATSRTRRSARPAFNISAWFVQFAKPLGGLAVAASVALITVIAVMRVDSPGVSSSQLAEADSQKVNIPVTAVVARPVTKPAVSAVAVSSKGNPSRTAAFLDAYLAEHSEFAAQDTMQGRMPYARAVSYESK